ncbi:MAG: insulinase family protein [Geminicoccaceae bacterium]|nr:insulinase family protein [Geminicoccaceae bacterium]
MNGRWLGMAVAIGVTVAQTAPVRAGLFNPETFTLDNGMQVVVIPNHRAPVVAHWVWYKVGTADSPPGKSGLPHFLEHLMFKATDEIPSGEFSKIVARNGGNDNAITSYDFTAYFQMIAKDRLELVMGMEADRMVNLKLTEDVVIPEREVVIEERRSRVENEPGSLMSEQLAAIQYLNHPYRLPVIGWMREMQTYDRHDAVSFYETWYAPNNAVLVVAGDITAEELRPMAERTYGRIAPRDVPARHRVGEPPQRAERRLELADPRVRQPSLVRSWLAPSYTADPPGVVGAGGGASGAGNAETGAPPAAAYALEVVSELFGRGGTSRLYKALVVDRPLAAGVGSYYSGTALDPTSFRIYASPRPGVTLDALEAALDEQVALLVAEGVSEEELQRVKKRMKAQAVYARDSLSGAARTFGAALTTGQTVADVEAWPDRIDAVTVDEANAVIRRVFVDARSVTGRLVPQAAVEEAGVARDATPSPAAAGDGEAVPAAMDGEGGTAR